MTRLFQRLSLPAKLMLIGIIPLAFLVYFAIQIYREKTEKIFLLERYQQVMETGAALNSLISEMQSERRYSFGYVVKGGWKEEMVIQRPRTDAALMALEKLDTSMRGIRSYTFLDSLPDIRKQLDKNQLSTNGVLNYYNNVIFRLNTLNSLSASNNRILAPVRRELAGQKLLSEMVTQLGRLRSNIYAGLFSGDYSFIVASGSRGVYDIYKSYEAEYLLRSSPASISAYQDIRNNSELKPTINFIESMFNTAGTDSSFDSEQWWDMSALAVDKLKVLQKDLLHEAERGVLKLYNDEKSNRLLALIFLLFSIVLVISFITFTISQITRSLRELENAAEKISTGRPGPKIIVPSQDVIASLARSINRIDDNNQVLARAADAIGSGNFDVPVEPRSTDDILGNAVVRMKTDLQQFSQENEEKLWIHGGVEKINDSLRGEKEVVHLAKDALHALAEYVQASVGFIYVRQTDFLKYVAGFAVSDPKDVPQEVHFGETVLGQAAQKKKMMQLKKCSGGIHPHQIGLRITCPQKPADPSPGSQ